MNIIFWLETIPVCCKGVFDAVANQWSGDVFYVCSGELSAERKKIACNSLEYESDDCAKYVFLGSQADKKKFVEQFIAEHKDDIHVFCGYKNGTIDYIRSKYPQSKIIVWAERIQPHWKNKFPMKLYHLMYAKKYKEKIDALLPLGEKGVECYKEYGWCENKLFPFLYLPIMNEHLPQKEYTERGVKTVRFVYLGRFTAGSKGIDVLIDAFNHIKSDNFVLDMVGGYGDYLDETMQWISTKDNVHFGGTWKIEEVCDKLHNYDVCIIPSKYEGWNVTLNEALMAGIGCVATDECVSDEMINKSGAGLVVRAGSSKDLARAIDYITANPEVVGEWSDRAFRYREKMTASICAKYFIDVVQYLYFGEEHRERPQAPWLM